MKCKNCNREINAEYKRVYCSNLCQIEYYNKGNIKIYKKDKWGRRYIECSKCGRRIKKIAGNIKFVCNSCYKKSKHKAKDGSQFITKELKRGREKMKVILEITEHNRNWHYVNGKPVLGFQKAINYFRAMIHTLTKRGWICQSS